jgi:tetratricopeptide (TPR) repeat protein
MAVLPNRSPAASGEVGRLIGAGLAATTVEREHVYELCGRGRAHLLAASMPGVEKAVEAFRAAAVLDPSYAPAHAGLALACCAQAAMRVVSPPEAYRDAKAAALRALAMDEACADALVALGTVLFFSEWDWLGAERSLRRALVIDATHVQGYLVLGRLLDALGRPQEALGAKWRALECDPLSPLVHVQVALSYWNQRRYDEAIHWANKALGIDSRHLLARELLVGACLKKRDFDGYLAEARRHAESLGVSPALLDPVKDAYERGGWMGIARCGLRLMDPQQAPALQLALFSADAGEIDAALAHLDRAIECRDPSLVDLAVAPQWDSLRADRRFEERVASMGLGNRDRAPQTGV